MPPFRLSQLEKNIAWGTVIFSVLWYQGAYPLLDNNEGLYASIARAMAEGRSSWIIPHLNGVPYIEKPPLLFWLIAICFKVFGIGTSSARLVPALAVLGTVAVLSYAMKADNATTRARHTAMVLYACSIGGLISGRMVYMEGLFAAMFSAALFLFYRWWKTRRLCFLCGWYGSLGLAILTKGFVSCILMGGILCVFLTTENGWSRWKHLFHPVGLLVFFCVSVPWHVLAAHADPDFIWTYFINEHVLRFLGQRKPCDYYRGSFWYYVPRLLIQLLPWTVFLGGGIRLTRPYSSVERFLLASICVPFLFFSFSIAKANYYLLLIHPFLSALLALRLKIRNSAIYTVSTCFCLGLMYLLGRSPYDIAQHSSESLSKIVLKDPMCPVYCYARFENISAFAFYYGLPVMIVGERSLDLSYGLKRTPKSSVPSLEDLRPVINQTPIFLLAHAQDESTIATQFPGMFHKVAENREAILLKSHPLSQTARCTSS
ncbi:MAG: glycosyltransferase family 39 protein [Holosporales bacterium]|jgi:4-amino-4-deoxy-L-arabinose transferase-like glycosyltransferase|nr:glycosyltransferase family 39 protein [Holosporales bacterium]